MVADGDKAGRKQADAALCPCKEILEHFVVRPAGLFCHLAVAHRRHHDAVFDGQAIDADRGEQAGIRIQLLRHTAGAALAVLESILREPVAVAVDQLLNQFILLQ